MPKPELGHEWIWCVETHPTVFFAFQSIFLRRTFLYSAPHGCAGVELEGDDAFGFRPLGVVVGAVEDEAAVHVVLEVRALGDDDDVVPVVDLEELGEPGLGR